MTTLEELRDQLFDAWMEADRKYHEELGQYSVVSGPGLPPPRPPKVIQSIKDFERIDELEAAAQEAKALYQATWRV